MGSDKKLRIEDLPGKALELGADRSAVFDVKVLQFSESFRDACKSNVCGKYDTNWKCPPAVGQFEQLKQQVLQYDEGIVIQSIYQLEDSFDYPGMQKAAELHNQTFYRMWDYITAILSGEFYPLNAGNCQVCPQCSYVDKQPCRFPEKSVSSIEAHGIDVNGLLTACGLKYNNGTDTVSYAGLFLFKKDSGINSSKDC